MQGNFDFELEELRDFDILSCFLSQQEPVMDRPTWRPKRASLTEEQRRQRRLARNRESAKVSRRRKKQKQETLEAEVEALEAEVSELKTQRFRNEGSHVADFLVAYETQKSQLFSRLKDSAEDERRAQDVIDQLRTKFGVLGSLRQRAVQDTFSQILEIALPAYAKYLMQVSSEGRDFFGEEQGLSTELFLWEQFEQEANITKEQEEQIRASTSTLNKYRTKLGQFAKSFRKIHEKLLQNSMTLSQIITYLETVLKPKQIASILLNLASKPKPLQSEFCPQKKL
eukprot:CAMPEP_0204915836 /NCGR_PEP_ID=MMETSP1397-20131031/13776_1 /ASSEMBLY_ACC=CAM_ASM_000891 /TAXON_ID=49980 /ORGANISM="Climacostomum Climacostomum virens, Strain Stock W-24" /LENGTH=283 /DNA_ID=CAMNT_0052088069 /DNA_START=6 /DNA_END=857 /DNA_ORIENTATION=-